MNPRYPVYVPTKGRHEHMLTLKALETIKVPHLAVIEDCDVENYLRAGLPQERILVQPTHNRGLVVTRNWIWDHAAASGCKRFWTFDDNIRAFYRLNRNLKVRCASGTFMYVIEDFVNRYQNVVIAGMQYETFAKRKWSQPAFLVNTRVYSNMLIETALQETDGRPFRNEGFYNDDTDLCLRAMKAGHCTVLFYAFLAQKMATMTLRGGMTEHYMKNQGGQAGREADGRYRMAKELRDKHRDCVRISQKWGRWQHVVDYSRFRAEAKLLLRPGVKIPETVNNYGMRLQLDGRLLSDAEAADHDGIIREIQRLRGGPADTEDFAAAADRASRQRKISTAQWTELLNAGLAAGWTIDGCQRLVSESFGNIRMQDLMADQFEQAMTLIRKTDQKLAATASQTVANR